MDYQWRTWPEAARFLHEQLNELVDRNEFARQLPTRLRSETGTRLFDWIDHLTIRDEHADRLVDLGFEEAEGCWEHPHAIFPSVRVGNQPTVAIKVDSVIDFAAANRLGSDCQITGDEGGPFLVLSIKGDVTFCAVERHGYRGFEPIGVTAVERNMGRDFYAAISQRPRTGLTCEADLFAETSLMMKDGGSSLGKPWACDIFFRAEREYWLSRNRAAQVQKRRQDRLGLGWGNHDHHTYRCSREHFASVVNVLELMGFECRERFYAGEQAGWGAQVLEHPVCRIVIFADVDLSAQEVAGDFAHDGLQPSSELGTVGLWCKLHGESFLRAGLHHLECQFDFDAARQQLAEEGIETMPPFTDFPHLRQAFTKGEIWEVDSQRLDALQKAGSINAEQAAKFAQQGAIGSHLEILERNDGYKGFNQTGISHIISATDPRKM